MLEDQSFRLGSPFVRPCDIYSTIISLKLSNMCSNNFQHVKTSQSHGNETDIQVRDPFIYLVLSCFPRQSAPLILEHLLSILMQSAVPQNPCPRLLRKVSKLFWNISTSKDCAPERRCEAWKRQQETNRNRDFHEVTGLKGKQKQHK